MVVGYCGDAEPSRRTNQRLRWSHLTTLQPNSTVIPAQAGIQYAARLPRDSIAAHLAEYRVDCFAVPLTDIISRSRGALRPRLASSLPSSNSEGAGKTGCLLHPRSRVRFALTRVHTSIQVQRGSPAFPAQWLYGLLRALPGERLFCLRRPRETSRQLSASTAAPEPHDFAVRFRRVRLSRPQRPPHPTARS